MVLDAVTRNFEIIGEAAHKIPVSVKENYPHIPWRQMYGLRNLTIHEYHRVDPKILWEIAQTNLPKNKIDLEAVLQEIGED